MNIKRRIEKLEKAKGIGIPTVLSNEIPYIFHVGIVAMKRNFKGEPLATELEELLGACRI